MLRLWVASHRTLLSLPFGRHLWRRRGPFHRVSYSFSCCNPMLSLLPSISGSNDCTGSASIYRYPRMWERIGTLWMCCSLPQGWRPVDLWSVIVRWLRNSSSHTFGGTSVETPRRMMNDILETTRVSASALGICEAPESDCGIPCDVVRERVVMSRPKQRWKAPSIPQPSPGSERLGGGLSAVTTSRYS